MKHTLTGLLATALACLAFASHACASITIDALDAPLIHWSLEGNGGQINPFNAAEVQNLVGTQTLLSMLYKSDHNGGATGTDSGTFAASYKTTFDPANDPSKATVAYEGAPYQYINDSNPANAFNELYIVVKDGNHDPYVYVFDLDAMPWLGTETIVLQNFWLGQGAISHVAIFGGNSLGGGDDDNGGGGGDVPEPATLAIWGLGMGIAGLVGYRRRRQAIA
jgi:hypothetical protein